VICKPPCCNDDATYHNAKVDLLSSMLLSSYLEFKRIATDDRPNARRFYRLSATIIPIP
jgi:hypothetical protein